MIQFGIDLLLSSNPEWKNQRVALVTNHAATTRELIPSRKALLDKGFRLTKLFSPEHGLDLTGADGHRMHDGADTLTGLPVTSLYSSKLAPSEQDLADIDILLFDIPDAGSRFYTYLWTMTHVMEACARFQKKLLILDRPNPISGKFNLVEGPLLEEKQASFIGRWPIPIRHSCTMGELALYFNEKRKIGCPIEVMPCKDWQRDDFQSNWGIPFVPTSPAIQHLNTMLAYPGLCLLEATNISEGRGTTDAFSLAGAPWIDEQLANMLGNLEMDEIRIHAHRFTPGDSKYKNELCNGVRIEVIHPEYFQPVAFGLLLIRLVKQLYPKSFHWAPYPTMVNPDGKQHLDKLLGIANSETLFELPLPKFIAEITRLTRCSNWETEIAPYLLY